MPMCLYIVSGTHDVHEGQIWHLPRKRVLQKPRASVGALVVLQCRCTGNVDPPEVVTLAVADAIAVATALDMVVAAA